MFQHKESLVQNLTEFVDNFGIPLAEATKDELEQKYGSKKSSYLYWPVTIDGNTTYHITCKYLGDTEYDLNDIKERLSKVDVSPPSDFGWTPHIFHTNDDGDVKVLLLTGWPESMKDCHDALEPLRADSYPDYKPHITVEPELWDRIEKEKLTPGDFKIEIGPLEMMQNKGQDKDGNKLPGEVVAVFKNKEDDQEE